LVEVIREYRTVQLARSSGLSVVSAHKVIEPGWQLTARSPWAGIKNRVSRHRFKKQLERQRDIYTPRRKPLTQAERKRLAHLLGFSR
jgi:hypothetical protein